MKALLTSQPSYIMIKIQNNKFMLRCFLLKKKKKRYSGTFKVSVEHKFMVYNENSDFIKEAWSWCPSTK